MICFLSDFIPPYVFVLTPMRSSKDTVNTALDRYDRDAGAKSDTEASRSTFMFIWISLIRMDLKPVRNSSARFGRILARKEGALNVQCSLHVRFYASCISSFKTLFSILGYILLSFGGI
jgi:hypothetical protein